MNKTIRRGSKGFTLVELMVVMSIIAVLAVLGLSGLININNNNTVDRAAEEIVTSIREAQNKAISVVSNPDGNLRPPLAWGVSIDSGAKLVQPIYTESDGTYEEKTFGDAFDYSTLTSINIVGDNMFFFTNPFGSYYSTNIYPTSWGDNALRPYDAVPAGVSSHDTTITLDYHGSTRVVHVKTNGDVYAQ
jgi:prepilin-type N-terminal cleavage/methylation domain-containing protein